MDQARKTVVSLADARIRAEAEELIQTYDRQQLMYLAGLLMDASRRVQDAGEDGQNP